MRARYDHIHLIKIEQESFRFGEPAYAKHLAHIVLAAFPISFHEFESNFRN